MLKRMHSWVVPFLAALLAFGCAAPDATAAFTWSTS